jgi:hypothetical protein
MPEVKSPHPEHEQHLCFLHNMGYVQSNLEDYKTIVRDANFVCKGCGRTAASDKNLCDPDKL